MNRRALLRLGVAGATAVLAGCNGPFGDDDPDTHPGVDGDADPRPEWPSVGRTPRNHAYHPTATTPRSESNTDGLPRRWNWRPSLPASGEETAFAGEIAGAVAGHRLLYTVVSGRLLPPEGQASSLNEVFAVDPVSGQTVWQSSFRDGIPLGTAFTPTVAGERLLVTGFTLQAFDTDGVRDWRVDPTRLPTGPPAVAGDDLYLPTAGGVECRALADGRERWTAPDGVVTESSTVAVDDETVYAGLGTELVALDRTDGTERWRTAVGVDSALRPGSRSAVGSPVVDDRRVYAAGAVQAAERGDNAALVALDRTDGTELWRYRPESRAGDGRSVAGVYGIPLLADGQLVAVVHAASASSSESNSFGIAAVDAADGTERWASALSRRPGTTVVGAGETVYAAAGTAVGEPTETGLRAFDLADGRPVGVGEIDGAREVVAGRPAVVADNAVVVPTHGGLVAFGVPPL